MSVIRSILSGRFALLGSGHEPKGQRPVTPTPAKNTPTSSKQPVLVEVPQDKEKAGLFVTEELEVAYQRVKTQVEEIARECRARNKKFRDIEFDLEEDRERCLHGLATPSEERSSPSDVRRVTHTFSNPQFFVDGADESDVVQGDLGDCWLLSGIATVASMPELVEKVCVARDEKVGVYGFIFQHDGIWRGVIVDDLLYTSIPKYEELTRKEQNLYHANKDKYNKTARLGSKSLYFAKSGTENETWVPLLEKAYAKLHGDYASLGGGRAGEAIEDLTGGVSTSIHLNDILDTDVFWKEELLRACKDRLFSCSIYELKSSYGSPVGDTVSGLYTGHAYSILKAVEYRGKRFLRIRNPWGNSEWTGRWSDGSKEWTPEWLDALEALGHTFGDDGAFIMEYEDWLDTWTLVHRVRLFDPSWIMSSLWINANLRGPASAWDYGDVSFTFTMPMASPAIITLAQLDDRYFPELAGSSRFTLDFKLFKKGEDRVLVNSSHATFFGRSVNAEIDLEAGEYVVHVRIDRQPFRSKDYVNMNASTWDARKLAAVLTRGAISTSIVSNFDADKYDHLLPRPLHILAGRDLHEVEVEAHERSAQRRKKPVTRGGPLATRSNTAQTGAGSEPVPPAASSVTVEDLSDPAAPTSPIPPSVSALIREADAADAGAIPTTDASAVTTASVTDDSPTPAQEENPSVKKMIQETAAIAGVQDLSVPTDLPTFKHVPGVGLVPETLAFPDTTVFGIANGHGALGKDAVAGGSPETEAPVVPNDADPTAIIIPASEDSTEPKIPAPAASTVTGGDKNDQKPEESPAAYNGEVPAISEATTGSEYATAASSPRATVDGLPGDGRQENVLLSTAAQMNQPGGHTSFHIGGETGGLGGQSLRPSSALSHVVHEGIVCDGECDRKPIVGNRYKCLDCEDYDICNPCMSKGVHSSMRHSFALIQRPEDAARILQEVRGALAHGHIPPPVPSFPLGGPGLIGIPPPLPGGFGSPPPAAGPPLHQTTVCDGCGSCPMVGTRYKCMMPTCPEFDLCSNCYNSRVSAKDHTPDHRMLAIASPEDAEHLIQEAEHDDDNELAIGLRVYTKKDCPTEIKGQLRHGKVIRWRHAS